MSEAAYKYFLKEEVNGRANWLWIVGLHSSQLIGYEGAKNKIKVYSYQKFIGRINPVRKDYQVATAAQVKEVLNVAIRDLKGCLLYT